MTVCPDPVIVKIPSLPSGWFAINSAILSDGRLAILGADEDLQAAFARQAAGEAKGEVLAIMKRAMARIWILHDDQLVLSAEFRFDDPFPLFDKFPDGRWIVAKSRSDGGPNARILSSDGSEVRRIQLGDGIEHLKIDGEDTIWVGWFDEGVCGNKSWKVESLEWPPSVYCVAGFDEMGRVQTVRQFDDETDAIDCYALNVQDAEVWACTYSDFPITSFSKTGQQYWVTQLDGSNAIAVSFPYVLAVGGYEGDCNRAVLLKLGGHEVETLGEWCLPFEQAAIRFGRLVDGRGDKFHVVEGDTLLTWSVSDFVRLCG